MLLGGRPGPRSSLEGVVYDYFLARFGARQAAEMHLVAFIKAVQRYRCGNASSKLIMCPGSYHSSRKCVSIHHGLDLDLDLGFAP